MRRSSSVDPSPRPSQYVSPSSLVSLVAPAIHWSMFIIVISYLWISVSLLRSVRMWGLLSSSSSVREKSYGMTGISSGPPRFFFRGRSTSSRPFLFVKSSMRSLASAFWRIMSSCFFCWRLSQPGAKEAACSCSCAPGRSFSIPLLLFL